jgi:hypothetical protein
MRLFNKFGAWSYSDAAVNLVAVLAGFYCAVARFTVVAR